MENYANFATLTTKDIELQELIDDLLVKIHALFNTKHNVNEDDKSNILGYFLYMKYNFIKNELIKNNAHVKPEAKYLVPLHGLLSKYNSLKVYLDTLITIPNIELHLNEVKIMLDYAMNPQPITGIDMFHNTSLTK